ERGGRLGSAEELGLADASSLIGTEHEGAVADHRAAASEAELVLLEVGFVGREEIAGVQLLVAKIFPDRSVDLVGAGTPGGDKQSPAKAAVLRAEVAGEDFQFLNGIGRRQIEDVVLERVLVGRAVETHLVLRVASAGDDNSGPTARLRNSGRRGSTG